MHSALGLFVIQLALVFVKAFQQRNVAHANTGFIIPTSFVFAALEIPSVGIIAAAFVEGQDLLPLIAASGGGAAIGCIAAVKVHQRIAR